jgi:hypothetical protein
VAKDQKNTQDKDLDSRQSQNKNAAPDEEQQSKTDEEVSEESVAASTPNPGNPYTVSADGRGRPYDPAVDGAPGKEAQKKQEEASK